MNKCRFCDVPMERNPDGSDEPVLDLCLHCSEQIRLYWDLIHEANKIATPEQREAFNGVKCDLHLLIRDSIDYLRLQPFEKPDHPALAKVQRVLAILCLMPTLSE